MSRTCCGLGDVVTRTTGRSDCYCREIAISLIDPRTGLSFKTPNALRRDSIKFGTDDPDVVVKYAIGPEPITMRLRRV